MPRIPRIPGALSVKQLYRLIDKAHETGTPQTIYVVLIRDRANNPDREIFVRVLNEFSEIVKDDKLIRYERKDGKSRNIPIGHARFFTNYWCLRSYILKYKGKEPVLGREYD